MSDVLSKLLKLFSLMSEFPSKKKRLLREIRVNDSISPEPISFILRDTESKVGTLIKDHSASKSTSNGKQASPP